MLEKFTKKDKRSDIQKEIDEVKIRMDKMKTDLDASNSTSLDYQIEALFENMSKVDPGSVDYLNMAKAQDALHKAKANVKSKQEEYSDMVDTYKELCKTQQEQLQHRRDIEKIAINVGAFAGMLAFSLYYEKYNVITTKVWSRLPWPKL